MSIEHRLIPDSELHEPKGINAAASNTAYFSNGLATGSWKKVGTETLKGLSGDAGVVGKKLITDGANGFTLKTDSSYGVAGVTNNVVTFPVLAAADSTLASASDYVLYTGAGAPLVGELTHGMSFDVNKLVVTVPGVYEVRSWMNISTFPSNTAAVGFRFRINSTTYSPRTAIVKSTAAGDYGNVSAFGLVTLAANDYVQLYIASTHAGNLVVQNLNLTVELKRAT